MCQLVRISHLHSATAIKCVMPTQLSGHSACCALFYCQHGLTGYQPKWGFGYVLAGM